MPDDFGILGIEVTDDPEVIKRAFRKRAKELHPDLGAAGEAIRSHFLFTEVCKAYRRLLAACSGQMPLSAAPGHAAQGRQGGAAPIVADLDKKAGSAVMVHADPAYVHYSRGMKYWMAIHPSQWNLGSPGQLATKTRDGDREQEEIRSRVAALAALFPRAWYHFSMVVHEYPESDWAYDAGEKMRLIDERVARYGRILESFSSWNADAMELVRKYHAEYGKHAETRRAITEEERRRWRE